MTFRIVALDPAPFAPLFALDDAELAAHGARRDVADAKPGYPCRVSLVDAEPGETLILANFVHQPAAGPFRASHAVYVREGAVRAEPAAGEVPALLRLRTLSLRAFDAGGAMIDARLVDGHDVEAAIDAMLALPACAEVHIHYAAPGCFAARAVRA